MKISCNPISAKAAFEQKTFGHRQYFELLAANCAEATDIMDPSCYGWFWQDLAKDEKEMPVLLRANGLKISAYATGNHFTVSNPADFQKQVELVKDAIRKAAQCGAPALRIFGGYHKDLIPSTNADYADGLEKVIRGIEAVLPEAESCAVPLVLENHGRLPGLSAEILFLMRHFDSPLLGVCFDIANMNAHNMNENEDAIRAYGVLKDYVKHVHFKDWKIAPYGAAKRTLPCVCGQGDGIVPLRQMAYLLEENRYPGYCALEYAAQTLEGIAQSLQYMNSLKKAAALLYPKET